MNPEQIYQALSIRNLNATRIAEALRVRPQTVSNVIRDGHGSCRITNAIAIAIETPRDTVFPYYSKKKQLILERKARVEFLKEKFAEIG